MTYKKAYKILEEIVIKSKWKIEDLPKTEEFDDESCWGCIMICEKTIYIKSSLNWKLKVKTLSHELGHALQSKEKKWKRFLSGWKIKDTPKNRQYVIDGEIDASERAMEILEILGFTREQIQFEEFDKKLVEKRLKKEWIKDHIILEKPI